MNRKNMPLLLMLASGAVTCIITFIQDFSIVEKLGSLLFVMVIFLFLGNVLKWTLDYFDRQNEAKRKAEEEAEALNSEEAEATKQS